MPPDWLQGLLGIGEAVKGAIGCHRCHRVGVGTGCPVGVCDSLRWRGQQPRTSDTRQFPHLWPHHEQGEFVLMVTLPRAEQRKAGLGWQAARILFHRDIITNNDLYPESK